MPSFEIVERGVLEASDLAVPTPRPLPFIRLDETQISAQVVPVMRLTDSFSDSSCMFVVVLEIVREEKARDEFTSKKLTFVVSGDGSSGGNVRINQILVQKTHPCTRMVSLSADNFANWLFPHRSFPTFTTKQRSTRNHYLAEMRDALAPHLKFAR